MRLKSFELLPKGPGGWGTGVLEFGDFLTILHGPNGSGKTPLLKAIMFALGYSVELPEEVLHHCASTRLRMTSDGGEVQIERALGSDVAATVTRGNKRTSCDSERKLSDAVLDLLAVPQRTLTDKAQKASPLYMSVFAPTFWVDQDLGWRSTYVPPKNRNFLNDQEEEIHRLVLGLPEKRVFVDKDELSTQKQRVAGLEERIQAKRSSLEARIKDGEGIDADALVELEKQREQLQRELERNNDGIESLRSSAEQFDGPIEAQLRVCSEIDSRASALRRQLAQLQKVNEQLTGEAEILGLNAVSADAFRSFCGLEGCRLFKNSEMSYGRRLLFLKDQTKDLEGSADGLKAEIDRLQAQLAHEKKAVEALQAQKRKAIEQRGHEALASAVAMIGQSLASVELKIARSKHFAEDRLEFDRLIATRSKEEEKLESLKSRAAKTDNRDLGRVRTLLEATLQKWIKILNTQNVPPPTVDDQLRISFGTKRFTESSAQSGSTRTRIVLAWHAAKLETSLEVGGHHPPLLVLDAPKQHELAEADLERYAAELRAVSKRHVPGIQVVLAVSDLFVRPAKGDAVWEPTFKSDGEGRYLGVAE